MLSPRLLVRGGLTAPSTPVILSLNASLNQSMSCFQTWRVAAGWTIGNPDNTNYRLDLYEIATGTPVAIQTNLNCADGAYTYDTGQLGDTSSSMMMASVQFRIDLVKRSDLSVIQQLTSSLFTQSYGSCGL